MEFRQIIVRAYAEADRSQVIDLWRTAFPDDPPRNQPDLIIDRKLDLQRELFLVALFEDRIIGVVIGGYDGFRGWIYHLAVNPAFRHRGFARLLVSEVETRLKALGCPKVNLQVRSHNVDVVEFYRRIGYILEEHVSMGKLLE